MRLFKLPGLLLLRSLVRSLTGIRDQLAIQNTLLTRIADHLSPLAPVYDAAQVKAESGVDVVDDTDLFLAQQFAARTYNDTGHVPTDEEILSYLADEKTRDLHQRLIDREREIDRLNREGR